MGIIPFAEQKLIRPGVNDPRISPRIGILHVDAGNVADLYDFFKDRSGGIEAHGHIRKDGHMYQYRDTAFEADANYKANPFALSFETQGYKEGKWTPEQIARIQDVIIWANTHHKIPFRKATSWNDPKGGWGYHILFDEWHPVPKSCPGPDRIKQFDEIIVPWFKIMNGEVPVAETPIELIIRRQKYQTIRLKRIEANQEKILKELAVIKKQTAPKS